MYIRKITIKNIRSIEHFGMSFPAGEEAGWHVLIGDNGAGKSTFVQAVALSLIGNKFGALRTRFEQWINKDAERASIGNILAFNPEIDGQCQDQNADGEMRVSIGFDKNPEFSNVTVNAAGVFGVSENKDRGWFSCSFGAERSFEGANDQYSQFFSTEPQMERHLSTFEKGVALSKSLTWLDRLNYKKLESNKTDSDSAKILKSIFALVNSDGFLPFGFKLRKITSEGIFFESPKSDLIEIHELSDGYRSILSMTLELIRLLEHSYGWENVFKDIQSGKSTIPCEGVVLIDEVDAHLHPTWQTRIGQWFTNYFPNIQFIVTTHSPLVCRAAEKGSIWRLPQPGTEEKAKELKGEEKDQLIYGDVLDAYETDAFGEDIAMGEEGRRAQKRYRALMYKKDYGVEMTAEEKKEFNQLQKIFHTNVASEE